MEPKQNESMPRRKSAMPPHAAENFGFRRGVPVFHPWKSRDPLAAIVMFVVTIVLLEAAFSFLPQNSLIRSFQAVDTSARAEARIQIIGDSVAKTGINPEQLAELLPAAETISNDAVPASGPEFAYFILKRKIEMGKIPESIIYAPSPHTFTTLRLPLLVGAFCNWREIREIASTGMEPFDVLEGLLCKLSYTLRHRNEIFRLFKEGRQKKNSAISGKVAGNERTAATLAYTVQNLHPLYKKRFVPQKFNIVYFEKFLQLARHHGIKVYWVTMPVLQVVVDCRKQYDFETEYYAFLDPLREKYGVTFLQREFLIFGEQDFRDHIHMNKAGAARFTELLAAKLAAVKPTQDRSAMNPTLNAPQ